MNLVFSVPVQLYLVSVSVNQHKPTRNIVGQHIWYRKIIHKTNTMDKGNQHIQSANMSTASSGDKRRNAYSVNKLRGRAPKFTPTPKTKAQRVGTWIWIEHNQLYTYVTVTHSHVASFGHGAMHIFS